MHTNPDQRCRATIHGGNGHCKHPAATDDGYCNNHDLSRRRARALASIVATDLDNHTIAQAVGLDITEVSTLRRLLDE
jgi:hypothetical protein